MTGLRRSAAAGLVLLAALAPCGDAAAADAAAPAGAPAGLQEELEQLNRLLRERQQRASPPQTPAPEAGPAPKPRQPPPPPPKPRAVVSGPTAGANAPPEEAIRAAIERLGDDDPAVRLAAKRDLVSAGAAAVTPLLDSIEDPDLGVRTGAITTLGEIGDPRAVTPLVELLGTPSKSTWDAVWGALHRLRRDAAPELVAALDDSDTRVRWRAVALMGSIRDPDFTEPLIDLLNKDRSTGVRLKIAWALGQMRDREATEALLDALHDW